MSEEFIDPPDIPEPQDPPVIIGAAPDANVRFLHYDEATGEIFGSGHCAESGLAANSALYPDLGFMVGAADLATQMVDVLADPPALVARPVFPVTASKTTILADGVDSMTFSLVPVGTTVTLLKSPDYSQASEVVMTGSTSVKTVIPAPMTFRFELFPYQTREVVINAV